MSSPNRNGRHLCGKTLVRHANVDHSAWAAGFLDYPFFFKERFEKSLAHRKINRLQPIAAAKTLHYLSLALVWNGHFVAFKLAFLMHWISIAGYRDLQVQCSRSDRRLAALHLFRNFSLGCSRLRQPPKRFIFFWRPGNDTHIAIPTPVEVLVHGPHRCTDYPRCEGRESR
jgi:hypothetical protein